MSQNNIYKTFLCKKTTLDTAQTALRKQRSQV